MAIIRPPQVPAGVPTAIVFLIRKWSDWEAGDVLELEAGQASRVIAKGYGIFPPPAPERLEIPDNPPIETTMLTPPAETATTGPQPGKHKPRGAPRSRKPAATPPVNKE